jgi:hypothetical protein
MCAIRRRSFGKHCHISAIGQQLANLLIDNPRVSTTAAP